jgi:[Skp1-protein]-hydroxyproline N-acetylglucosaminyltransferase
MKQVGLFLIIGIVFLIWYRSNSTKRSSSKQMQKYFSPNYSQNTTKPNKNGKIFVSIASYRDPLLKQTLESLLQNCDNRLLLRIVVCEQNSIHDSFSLHDLPFEVEMIRMSHTMARGPCWARYLIQQKYQGEEYYLQIDSHTKFLTNGWDTTLKTMLNNLPENSCLSNYVASFDHNTGQLNGHALRGPMKVVKIDQNDKFVRFNSPYIKSMEKPMLSHGWSGCFSFSSANIILDAPYDPYVPFLFFGEEMDIYLRLRSRGWSMYVPNLPICATVFDRSYRKTFWEHPDKNIVKLSRQRLYDRFNWIKCNDPLIIKKANAYSINSHVNVRSLMYA